MIAPIVGSTLGGWITDSYSWRGVFLINLPVGLLALAGCYAYFATQTISSPSVPKDLKNLPCIRFRFASGHFYEWEFERDGARLSVEVDGQLTLGEPALAVRAALDGAGIAFAFEEQVKEYVAQGRLVRVLEDWCPQYAGYHLYYPSRRHLPATLRAFIDFTRTI